MRETMRDMTTRRCTRSCGVPSAARLDLPEQPTSARRGVTAIAPPPVADPITQPFCEGVAEHRLVLKMRHDSTFVYPPEQVCPCCGGSGSLSRRRFLGCSSQFRMM